jgi:hypothetical protein
MARSGKKHACSICEDAPETREFIESRLARGESARGVSRDLNERHDLRSYDYRTISAHWRRCLGHSFKLHGPHAARRAAVRASVISGDVAITIRDAAIKALEAGDMRRTANHALRAQELLDRRSERHQDMEVALLLARVLTSQPVPERYVGRAEPSREPPLEEIAE